MTKRLLSAAFMALTGSLLTSCVPIPTTTPVYPALTGYVVDTEGYAIPGATVIAERAGYVRQCLTHRKNGMFVIPSVTQVHHSLISGPPGVKPPPWFWQRGPLPLTLTASAPGYEVSEISIPSTKKVPFPLQMPDRLEFRLQRLGGQTSQIGDQPSQALPVP